MESSQLEQEEWEIVRFPAIAEEDEVHNYETVWGPVAFRRRHGDALHPDREPREVPDQLRRTLVNFCRC